MRGAVRFPLAIPLEEPERGEVGQRDVGIMFYQNDRGEGTVEGLMMSLHALRKYWDGEVTVLFSGEESPSVRIACARYAALYREVPEPEVMGDPRVVRQIFIDPEAQVREWSPYTRTLWMEAGLTGQEREIQKFLRRADSGKSKPAARTVTALRRDPAREARQTEARAALEVEVMLAWAATARVRHGATVVQALLPEDLPGFERNWTATRWRHAAMTLDEEPHLREPVPVLLVLCDGVTPEDATHAMRHRAAWSAPEPDSPPPPTVGLTREHVPPAREESAPDEPHWTHALATAAAAADTEWLLYVDPMMHPSPGAELFLPYRLPDWGAEEQPFAVYAPGWAFRRIGDEEEAWVRRVYGSPVRAGAAPAAGQGEVSAFPDDLRAGQILKHLRLGPSATMIRRDLMLAAYAEWGTHFPEIPFEIFLTLRLRRDGMGYGICRPQDWGWNL